MPATTRIDAPRPSGDGDELIRRRPMHVLAISAAVAGAIALWFGFLGSPALWTDEALTLHYASSWSTVGQDFHPPLYYSVLHLWFEVVTSSLVSARALSALAYLAAVIVWAVMARRWWREGRLPFSCVLTVVLLSIASPHALLFGRMARYFGLAALALSVAVWAFCRARREDTVAWAAAAVATHVLLGIVNPQSLVVVLGAETVMVVLRDRGRVLRHVVHVLATAALAVALLAVLPTDTSTFAHGENINHLAMAGVAVVYPVWSMTVGETVSPFNPIGGLLPALAWCVLLVGLVAGLRAIGRGRDTAPSGTRSRRASVLDRLDRQLPADPIVMLCLALVVVQIAVQVVVNFTVDLPHTAIQAPKYFLPVAPAVYLLIGIGVARVRAWRGGGVLVVAVLTSIGLGWSIGIVHLQRGTDFLYPSYAMPWNDVVQHVDQVVEARAAQGHRVAVVASDVAFQRLLVERAPAADVLDVTASPENFVVYDGQPGAGNYDTWVYVTRQRLNVGAEKAVEAVLQATEMAGFAPIQPTQVFGSVNPTVRHLQERISGRDLEPYLVRVVALGYRPP